MDESLRAVESLYAISDRGNSKYFSRISSLVNNEVQLADDFRIAIWASLNKHAYPTAVIRALLGDQDSGVTLVTRSRVRREILAQLTDLKVVVLPFSDLLPRLAKSLKFGSHNLGANSPNTYSTTSKTLAEKEVIFFPHKGLSYGQLYTWEQYFSKDSNSPCHPTNLGFCDYQINGGSLYKPRRFLAEVFRLTPRILVRMKTLAPLPIKRRMSILLPSIRLATEARILASRIRTNAPKARVALLSYEMLTPTNLSIALRASGVKRIANLERGTVYLTGLPVLVDTLTVPNERLQDRLRRYPLCSAASIRQVGHWRNDYLVATSSPQSKFDVLILPYHVSGPIGKDWGALATSCFNFSQHLNSILKLCDLHKTLQFCIRTKDALWLGRPELGDLVDRIRSTPNLSVATDYSTKAFTYSLARSARLAIGRFSSIHEELYDAGVPILIDNRGGVMGLEYQFKHLEIPAETVCMSEEDLLAKANIKLLNQHDDHVFRHRYSDGGSRERIIKIIETELEELYQLTPK